MLRNVTGSPPQQHQTLPCASDVVLSERNSVPASAGGNLSLTSVPGKRCPRADPVYYLRNNVRQQDYKEGMWFYSICHCVFAQTGSKLGLFLCQSYLKQPDQWSVLTMQVEIPSAASAFFSCLLFLSRVRRQALVYQVWTFTLPKDGCRSLLELPQPL